MDTVLCICLSLHIITSPGTYTQAQISNFEQIYSVPIANIENNLPLLALVLAGYEPEVPEIIITENVGAKKIIMKTRNRKTIRAISLYAK